MTGKQRLFVEFYCGEARGNASEAARLAGYSDVAHDGYRLKKHKEVWAAIEAALKERTLSGEEVLERLTQHANASIAPFIYSRGDVVMIDLSREEAQEKLHLLKKVKTKRKTGGDFDKGTNWEEITTEIELHDPQAALVHLGRHHRLFIDRHEMSGPGGGPIPIRDVVVRRPERLAESGSALEPLPEEEPEDA